MKLTFRRHPTSPVDGVDPYQSVDIEADGYVCGMIECPSWFNEQNHWRIILFVNEDQNWNSKDLNFNGQNEQQCRDFLIEKWDTIIEKWDLCLVPKGTII